MKKLLFLFLTLLIVSTSQAQNDSVNYKHSLGLSAGFSTGLGFSYRYWPNKIGFQVTGIPIFSNNQFFSSSAVSILLRIKDFNKIRLFAYLGNNLNYRQYSNPSFSTEILRSYDFSSALGVGFRFNLWEYFDLNLQTGYGVLYEPQFNYFQTTIAGEIGFYYHF